MLQVAQSNNATVTDTMQVQAHHVKRRQLAEYIAPVILKQGPWNVFKNLLKCIKNVSGVNLSDSFLDTIYRFWLCILLCPTRGGVWPIEILHSSMILSLFNEVRYDVSISGRKRNKKSSMTLLENSNNTIGSSFNDSIK